MDFWSNVEKSEGCWLWKAGKNNDGYGYSYIWGKPAKRAHRVAWELVHGPIPTGLLVLHHCDNPSCVKPDHLFLGTNFDNMRDCESKKRGAHSKKEFCLREHPFDEDNTYVYPSGRRNCRQCDRVRHSASIPVALATTTRVGRALRRLR